MSDAQLLDDGGYQRYAVRECTYDVTKIFDEEVEGRSKQLRSYIKQIDRMQIVSQLGAQWLQFRPRHL